jgi:hypothetical protein
MSGPKRGFTTGPVFSMLEVPMKETHMNGSHMIEH